MISRFRLATHADEVPILRLYNEAKELLASRCVDQWQKGGPDATSFHRDVNNKSSYLLEVKDEEKWVPAGTMFLSFEPEPTYSKIEGEWASTDPYAVIHRVTLGSDFRGHGLSSCFFEFACREAQARGFGQIRIDTHEDNKVMQKTLARLGFQYRGIIWLHETERKPWQKRYAYDVSTGTLIRALESRGFSSQEGISK